MLYAPLRTAIYADAENRTRFAVDQSSTVFASCASPPISQVGVELDRKLGTLLDALDALDVPAGGVPVRPDPRQCRMRSSYRTAFRAG
jgi:hypothetical protein